MVPQATLQHGALIGHLGRNDAAHDLVRLLGRAILRPAQQHIAAYRPLHARLEAALPVEQDQRDAGPRQCADQRRRDVDGAPPSRHGAAAGAPAAKKTSPSDKIRSWFQAVWPRATIAKKVVMLPVRAVGLGIPARSDDQRPVEIEVRLGADVLDPALPVCAEMIVAQTIVCRIEILPSVELARILRRVTFKCILLA